MSAPIDLIVMRWWGSTLAEPGSPWPSTAHKGREAW